MNSRRRAASAIATSRPLPLTPTVRRAAKARDRLCGVTPSRPAISRRPPGRTTVTAPFWRGDSASRNADSRSMADKSFKSLIWPISERQ